MLQTIQLAKLFCIVLLEELSLFSCSFKLGLKPIICSWWQLMLSFPLSVEVGCLYSTKSSIPGIGWQSR